MITLLLCNYYRRFGSQTIPFLISIFLFIGVLSTGTRSVYVAVCIGLIPLILNYASKVKYILLLVIIASIVYTNNQEMFDNIVDSFSETELGYYDVTIYVESGENTEPDPMRGYKNKNEKAISWTVNKGEVKDEE